jgi:hypothetical protein
MSTVNQSTDTDHCPCCLRDYEIVALKFHFFEPASALMVCMTCAMVQSDSNDQAHVLPKQRSRQRVAR